jgi:kumamolisin
VTVMFRPRWTVPLIGVVVLALVASAGLASAATGPAVPPAAQPIPSSPGVSAAELYSVPFATSAGYSPSYVSESTDSAADSGSVLVVVTFKTPDPALFDPPVPGAAPLTQSQVGQKFGLSATQYSAAEQYFVSQGLSIVHTWADRLSLTLSGPVASVDHAFGTTVLKGQYDGRVVTFPASAPALPGSLESEVAGVTGLSTGFTTFSMPLTDTAANSSVAPAQGGSLITPAVARNNLYDVSGLYNLTSTPTYSTDQQVAIILWGDGYDPSDLGTFFSQYYPSGFPAPIVQPYPVDGAPAPGPGALGDPDAKAPQELTLDIEWAGSMAAGATIDAVYAPDGPAPNYSPTTATMIDALNKAISLNPDAISMSFGTTEQTDASLQSGWDTALASAAQSGITLLAATGDTGGDANGNCTGGLAPQYPSTNPDVLAVGGTDVSLNTNVFGDVTGFSESGWSLSGGGFSTQYPAPSWQTSAIPSSQSGGQRGIPDVSATAALNFVYYDGQSLTAAGTSFATPLWAGLIVEMDALHGRPLGFLTPRLYSIGTDEPSGKIGQGLADITSGSNCQYSAGPGWDAVTGWGSPRGVTLYEELTATFVNLSIGSSVSAIPPGGSVTISAHLANGTTGRAIANVPVQVTLASDIDLGPCTGSFGSATPTTDANGNVSVALSVPVCYLGSHAVAQVLVTSDALYGVNATSIGVDLLAFAPFLDGITSYPANVLAYTGLLVIAIAIGILLGHGRNPSRRTVRHAANPGPPAAVAPMAPAAAGADGGSGGAPEGASDAPPPLPEPAPDPPAPDVAGGTPPPETTGGAPSETP